MIHPAALNQLGNNNEGNTNDAKGLNLPIKFRVLAGIAVLVVLVAAAACYFVVGISSRVQTLEDKVAALEEEILNMNTKIHELDSKFATMQGAMITSIARINGAAKLQAHERSTLKDQVDRAEASVDGINALVQYEVQAQIEAIMNEWDG
ncbi:hypothetical protein THAOC_04833 [Thalassiosira oceanica]|uniref:Uncharacterized protein n=1 Tax=Thalassiosira oceanica TaxID=159749 RepID=K0TNH5_THAOC|nr:hypothetical protein THAOC_04833 [Thalassiosira oceanica]|eukprot:EJK73537.1 hypothetical protein THAOC_04833 [Thalassiosira oceanica]